MTDVNTEDVSIAPQGTPGEAVETPAPESQAGEQTPGLPGTPGAQAPVTPERTIPYTRFAQVNKQYRDAQKKLAELQSAQQFGGMDPNDTEAVLQHPFVQELLLKQAKTELTDFAKEVMDQYPTLNPQVKKAILRNVRGFVNEGTSDVETAKLDLQEYLESILESEQTLTPAAPVTPKIFPVANTNSPHSQTQTNPQAIQKILSKPVDTWTEGDEQTIEAYLKANPKK